MAHDKKLHFVAGFIVAIVVGLLVSPLVGFAASAVIGSGKEVYDRVTKTGNPEYPDFVATFVGGSLAASILSIIPP